MSNRSERREAERLARKKAYLESRNKPAQSLALDAVVAPKTVAAPNILSFVATEETEVIAQLKTGKRPATPFEQPVLEGRERSAMNATKHGCCADTLILPHESVEDYKAVERAWHTTYKPTDDVEKSLIEKAIQADWFLQRATRAMVAVEADLYKAKPNPSDWTEAEERKLGRFQRYQTARTNIFKQAKKLVEDHRRARRQESERTIKITIAQERLEAYKRKNRPEPTWKEKLAEMKQQAIALGFNPPPDPRVANS